MHMQAGDAPSSSLTSIEGIWEAQVANGVYDVTVSVGDGSYTNSTHSINVEGVNAMTGFIPTVSQRFDSATVTISVSDGLLTIDAVGGINTKINSVIIKPTTGSRPSVVSVKPENGSQQVSENTSISTSILDLPNGGIDNATITVNNVYLIEDATGIQVPSNVNGTGGGDAITLVPASKLKSNTAYTFNITNGVKDLSGASFISYSSTFTTGRDSTGGLQNVKFDKIALPNTTGRHSSLTMGPDGKLYALTIDGMIKRFPVNTDGMLGTPDTLYSLQDSYTPRQQRLAIGFTFDPTATANNLVAWVTHSSFAFLSGPAWDGKLTRLSGNNLQNVQEVLINLPRSVKDHVTNSIAFGPDGKLYFNQGSTSAMGKADNTWGNRDERLLSGAVLRLDISKLSGLVLPLNVKTPEGGGSYNPYDSAAPLTIYASGVRNAYDLVWHSNGNLYVPTNGSAAGGNTPASTAGTLRPDGTTYNGPAIPALTNVQQTQKDFLFRVVKGGYYGHPNPLRGEYVMNGGNPTTSIDSAQVNDYPVGTLPDSNWRRYAFDFQNNKSPNGAIEYKSNTFDGALKGKLLVVRYSQNDDIITLTPGGPNNDIVSSTVGTGIEGFTGFVDPLDLTEDTLTGNIYVSEYGGNGKIDLLRPRIVLPTTLQNSNAPVDSVISSENASDSALFSLKQITDTVNNLQRPKVYPNPFRNKLNVQFPANYHGAYYLKIADISGRIYNLGNVILKTGGSNMVIDVSKLLLKKGVYFLRIISQDGKRTVVGLISE
ncbi:MAG: Ig-like domain-containing protein, partial [Ginsengibacter sp.]